MTTATAATPDSNLTVMGAALVAAAKGASVQTAPAQPSSTSKTTSKVTPAAATKASAAKPSATKPASAPSSSKTTTVKTVVKPTAKAPAKDPADFLQVAASRVAPLNVYWPETYTLAVNEKPNDVRGTPNKKVIEIRLYDESCFGCHHVMVGDPEVENVADEDCHHSKGNIYCPAAHVRFRSVGKKMRLLHKMRKAQERGDVNKLSALIVQSGEDLSADDRLEVLRELGILPPEGSEDSSDKSTAQPAQG